eukprot:gene7493-9801_t
MAATTTTTLMTMTQRNAAHKVASDAENLTAAKSLKTKPQT